MCHHAGDTSLPHLAITSALGSQVLPYSSKAGLALLLQRSHSNIRKNYIPLIPTWWKDLRLFQVICSVHVVGRF